MDSIITQIKGETGETFYPIVISYKLARELGLTYSILNALVLDTDIVEVQADEKRILIGTKEEIDNLKMSEEADLMDGRTEEDMIRDAEEALGWYQ